MKKKYNWKIILVVISIIITACGNNEKLSDQVEEAGEESIYSLQITIDSLFNSAQSIYKLALPKSSNGSYTIKLAYNEDSLIITSRFAAGSNAIAAINGGFFNMAEGGSATYLEISDSVIARTRDAELEYGIADTVINATLILNSDGDLKIEPANSEKYYEDSEGEDFVLISGPLLISNSEFQKLPDYSFSRNRHPRTCVGITNDSIFLVAVDGRSEVAMGMSLYELQKYMYDLGCTAAINLDGGGSTTMWTKDKGVINNPSDKNGERPVANALLILE